MSITAHTPPTTPIPVQLAEPACTAGRFPPLAMPQPRAEVHTRLSSPLHPHLLGALYRDAMAMRAHATRRHGPTRHARDDRLESLGHMDRGGVAPTGVHGPCGASCSRAATRGQRATR